MKPGMPWSVKGIDQETREAAKDAARRSGMTLGEWLNSMIMDQADEPGAVEAAQPDAMSPPVHHHVATPAEQPRPTAPVTPSFAAAATAKPAATTARRSDASIRLEQIAEQLAQLARRDQETAPQQPAYTPPAARQQDVEQLSRIVSRIESNERQTVEAFSAVNERLAALGRQLAVASKEQGEQRAGEPAALKSLEQAVRNIVEHLELSEKRSRDSIRSLQERIVDVASKQTVAPPVQINDEAISSLEQKYQELMGRVERSEQRVNPSDQLRADLSQLAERVETVRSSAEQLATRAQTAAVQTSQRELREIETRILGVLKEAQSAFNGQGTSSTDIQNLRSEIAALNHRIDGTRAGLASERDVASLRVAFEQLQGRVAQGPDSRPLAEMDRRLNDLTRRVDQAAARPATPPDLDRRLTEIDSRMKDLARMQAQPRDTAGLERKISEVADRMSRAETGMSQLATIERAVGQLFESIDHNRAFAKDAAEDAANRMAQRLLAELPRAAAPAANAGTFQHSAELRALEDGLRAVKESAANSDQRNQETLEAVHETLEQIINKLAELETTAVGHQLAQATALQAAEVAAVPQQAEWPQSTYVPPPEEPAHVPLSDISASVGESGLAEDFAEPSFGAAPSPQWQADIPPADNVPGHAPADDYIAAARRAALAAAQSGGIGAIQPAPDAEAKSGSFLKNLTRGRKREAAAAATVGYAPRNDVDVQPASAAQGGMRRTLLLAGMVLLMAVGAFWINARPSDSSKNVSSVPASSLQRTTPTVPQNLASAEQSMVSGAGVQSNDTGDVVTGSLQKPDASLQSLVAEPGTVANTAEMPPTEIGNQSLRAAARDGNTSAQFIVATRFLDGNGIEADVTSAARWYQKAADGGLAPAQYRLATLFERGRGVPKDAATAFVWYKRAAEQGNVKSMHNVAVLAAGNEVGAPNYELAYKWFLAASQHGLKDSEFNLALLYERGLGTQKNPQEALFWYMIAAGNKDADAAKRVSVLSASLPPDVVALTSKKVQSWTPEPSVDAANVVSIKDPAWQDNRAMWIDKSKQVNDDLAYGYGNAEPPAPQQTVYRQRAASFAPPPTQAQPAQAELYQQASYEAPTHDPLLGQQSPLLSPLAEAGKISTAQNLLMRLGYDVDYPSGQMDVKTANAIRLFEFQTRQKVTGRVTENLVQQLQAYVG